jgi:hypothetical protein
MAKMGGLQRFGAEEREQIRHSGFVVSP